MEVTLTLPDHLAAELCALAEQRGVSVEDLGRQALTAGLAALEAPLPESRAITWLGALAERPPSTDQLLRMRSPLIALGPVPHHSGPLSSWL